MQPSSEPDDSHIRRQNKWAAIFIGSLIVFALWAADGYRQYLEYQKCLDERRFDCNRVEIHSE